MILKSVGFSDSSASENRVTCAVACWCPTRKLLRSSRVSPPRAIGGLREERCPAGLQIRCSQDRAPRHPIPVGAHAPRGLGP